jgi:hypothetical protein
MNRRHWLALAGALALGVVGAMGSRADAGFHQSYSAWHKSPYHYYYRYYYSAPQTYDYVILYPAQPRYLYYYNPVSKIYWGRYDLKAKGYSLLAEVDRKGLVKDIPEAKFPEPGDMPQVPGGQEGEKVQVPPDDLPADLPVGEDLTAKNDPAKADTAKTDTAKTDTAKTDADPAKPIKTPDTVPTDAQPASGSGAVTPAGSTTTVDAPKPTVTPDPPAAAPGPKDPGPAPVQLPPGKAGCDKSCPKNP